MHRLVIALTAFLAMVGVVVVAGYLFVFAAQADRAARAVPAGTAAYATVYLQPSTGQMMNLASVLGRVPGFADAASLEIKIHDITARLLGEAGVDYEADVRPWLGNQVSIAVQPEGVDPAEADVLVVMAVKDRAAAEEALPRLAGDLGLDGEPMEHEGTTLTVADGATWALLDDILLIGSTPGAVTAGLDADAGRAESLADSQRFARAMDSLPADHIAVLYVDLDTATAAVDAEGSVGGHAAASMALLVEPEGLHLVGTAPYDADAASSPANEAFELSREASTLAEWMPDGTQAELTVFGLAQTIRDLEQELSAQEALGEVSDAINQLRAIAALGLGISIDEDLLPLFDRESAVAISGLEGTEPSFQLLLRPSDAAAAEAALQRVRDAVEERGAAVDEDEAAGTTITSIEIPDVVTVAYAIADGVVIGGLNADDVAAVLEAHEAGRSLAATDGYRAAWELAGTRRGNEAWVDVASLLDAAGDDLGVTGEARDILLEVGAIAMTAPSAEDHTEIHLVLTVR